MDFDWFILDELNQIRGPYRLAGLIRLLERGDLLVWREGFSDWKQVSSIHELGVPVPNIRTYELNITKQTGENNECRPGSRSWFARQNFEKICDELLGICEGLIADTKLNDEEIFYLQKWLEDRHELIGSWPANAIARRIENCLADGAISERERQEMLHFLRKVGGGSPEPKESTKLATRLPVEEPPPKVEFQSRSFCFTGQFIFGSRSKCESSVIIRGGTCDKVPKSGTDFLVIGTMASRDWAHGSYGRKIEDAVFGKKCGWRIQIISEEHWTTCLENSEPLTIPTLPAEMLGPFAGRIFVITGTLPLLSRGEASAMIRAAGGDVSYSVCKNTDYLIAGAEAGSKLEKAQKLGVHVLDEAEFRRLLGEETPV